MRKRVESLVLRSLEWIPSLARFEVALLPVALVYRNPTRKRGMSQYQLSLAYAAGYEKNATGMLLS
ncbi:hypothetical protein Pla100_37710 [Neorhodopirellula pilleata]|uniref:Uncharacterized protein n=1 Tax=Neorhodopirellula pilleata TaxID=2714738 RepID=A0A5C6A2P4_9BACT|nr:hypothetical protein Pla100_37710 [Neorhodopirellula pilleata]